MRVFAFLLLLSVGDAFAAAGANNGEVLRLDFANSPAFQSAFENRFTWPGASDNAAASDVPAKTRVALWTSQSVPHYRAEVLRAVLPAEILVERVPRERITAKTVRSASLESAPPAHHEKKRKQLARTPPPLIVIEEDEEPSILQSIFGALLPGG